MTIPMPPVTTGLVWFEDGDTHAATYGVDVAGAPVDRMASGFPVSGPGLAASTVPTGFSLIPNNDHALLYAPGQLDYVTYGPYIQVPYGQSQYTDIWVIPGGIYSYASSTVGYSLYALTIDAVIPAAGAPTWAAYTGIGVYGGVPNAMAVEPVDQPYQVVANYFEAAVGANEGAGTIYLNGFPTSAVTWGYYLLDPTRSTLYSWAHPCYAHLIYDRKLTQDEHDQIQAWVEGWSAPRTPPVAVTAARGGGGVTLSWPTGESLIDGTRWAQDEAGTETYYNLVIPAGGVPSPYLDATALSSTSVYGYNLRFSDGSNGIVISDTKLPMTVTAEPGTTDVVLTWDGPAGSYEVVRNGVLANPMATSPFTDIGLTSGTYYAYQVTSVSHRGIAETVTLESDIRVAKDDAWVPAASMAVSVGGSWVEPIGTWVSQGGQWVPAAKPAGSTITSLTATPVAVVVGDAVTLTADTTANKGYIQFEKDGVALGSRAAVDPDGIATLTDIPMSVGSTVYGASYVAEAPWLGGDALDVTVPVSIGQSVTDVVVNASPEIGGQFVVAAHTTGYSGTVQFQKNGAVWGTPVPVVWNEGQRKGIATLPDTGVSGVTTYQASYSGDSNWLPSTSAVVSVNGDIPITKTTFSAVSSSICGTAVTLEALVIWDSQGTPITEGTVQFSAAGVNIGGPVAVDASGYARVAWTVTDATSVALRADYLGTANFNASYGSRSISPTINCTITISCTPNPVNRGQNLTVSGNVTAIGSSKVPTGQVDYYDIISPVKDTVSGGAYSQVWYMGMLDVDHNIYVKFFGSSNFNDVTSVTVFVDFIY
jgi:Bacterial Ig-like domain (group 3)